MAVWFVELFCLAMALFTVSIHKLANWLTEGGPLIRGIKSIFNPQDDADPDNDDNDPIQPPSIENTKNACIAIVTPLLIVLILSGLIIAVAVLTRPCIRCMRCCRNRTYIKRLQHEIMFNSEIVKSVKDK